MTSTLEILKEARALISKPEYWTRDKFARNSAGFEINPKSREAVCFCALGALRAASDGDDEMQTARDTLAMQIPDGFLRSVADFNDDRSHDEVLALFDRAIATVSDEFSEKPSHGATKP